ncbi:MAG: hypothetical protein KatS3mg032_0161 [Cyclobacteriaceae bacterium]|nr:MAG: hypothetical protein KatS3mg032_0161 [Cyclobacteriaceae bacterium]
MLLDFEKPIAELEAKLKDMKALASDSDDKIQEAIKALEQKIIQLKKETFENLTGWQRVQLSRHPDRPYALDYIYEITSDFIELHGDRQVADDKAMVGGLGTIEGQTFMLIGQQKGRTTKQRQLRNFGMANPEGYRKALRLMKIAEKFNKPIVTFIDTPGAYPGLEAEERGQGEAIARNLKEMFALRGTGNLHYYWRGRLGWCAGHRHWRPRVYARKHLVLCHFTRIMFVHSLAKLGIQKSRQPKC